jgi:hypothetical protein
MGNQLVMGPMSQLSPLDVQIPYKGTCISATTFMRFFARASEWFEKATPDEAPSPRRALTDKLDPFIMEEWSGLIDAANDYAREILQLAGCQRHTEIAQQLVLSFPSHGYVITPERAKHVGLNVKDSSAFEHAWEAMRYWLSKYMFEQEFMHCIRYALPQRVTPDDQSPEKKENK